MPYLNSRLRALFAAGLLLLGVPGLHAQDAPATAAIRGDVDGDGRVTRADAEAVRAFLVRGTLPGGRSILPSGDANADGRVTAADAALISRFAAGVDVSRFPVGRPIDGPGRAPTTDMTGMLFTQLECEFTVANGTTACRPVTPGANGALLDVIVGAPYVTVTGTKVVSNGDQSNPDTSTVTYTITNKIPQPIGTVDGTTLHPNGIRMFFVAAPRAKNASGAFLPMPVSFDPLPDSATFTSAQGVTHVNKKYIQFNKVLPLDSSAMQSVRFTYADPNKVVDKISVGVFVATPVQYEHGWVTVTPAAGQFIAVDSTVTLSGAVQNQVGQNLADGVNWSSSNNAIATVNGSGVVTGVAEGTVTITATSTVNNNRTGTRSVTVDRFPTVTGTTPADNATGVAANSDIVITFSEPVNVSVASFSLECPDNSAQTFAVSGSGTNTITLNPDANLPTATLCVVTVDGNQVTDVDTNDGPNMMPGNYTFDFEVAIQAFDDVFGTTTTGNVRINSAAADPVFSVTANDQIVPATTTITFAGWSGVGGKTLNGGDVVMDTEGAGMGTFTYNPPAGFEGTDSLEYTVQSGASSSSAKVALPVSGMIWFVNNAAAACTSRASGCGRLTNPYSSLAAFQAENNGTGNNPAAGDNVFLYESATSYAGPVALLAQQRLIGQDAGATLSTISGITPATGSDALPAMNAGGNTAAIDGAVTLATSGNNTVRGLTLAPAAAGTTALTGLNFGTLTVADLVINAAGQALSLTTGALSGSFTGLSSAGGTNNVLLSGVTTSGTATLGGAGSALSGATSGAVVITGQNGSFTYPGTINSTAGSAVNVGSKTGGTVTFSGNVQSGGTGTGISVANNAGTTVLFSGNINPSAAGPGITVSGNSASTSVTFSGTVKSINSGAAGGVTLTSNTGASVAFTNGGLAIATTTGVPFTATGGGTVDVAGAGNTISVTGAAARAVNLNGVTLGATGVGFASIGSTGSTTSSAFFATGVGNTSGSSFTAGSLTVAGTTGGTSRGLEVSSSSAPFTFTTVSVNGTAAEGIYLSGNTGAVAINGGTVGNTSSPAGDALFVSGGNAAVTVAASLTKSSAGRISNITGRTGGTTTVSGALSCTGSCTGISGTSNTGGTIQFTNGTKTLTTGGSAAVSLSGNTNSTVNFTGGGLAITTTSGAGFSATTSAGGTVTVEGANNTITTTTGNGLTVTDVNIGGNGLTFRSITAGTGASGPANGMILSNTGTLGFVTVTGDGSTAGSGGTIQRTSGGDGATAGNGVYLNGTRNVSLSFMNFNDHGNNGLYGTGVRGLTLNRVRFTGNNGTSNSGTFNESAVHLVNLGGAVKFSGSRFDGGAMNAVRVDNSSGTAPALDSLVFVNDTVATMQGSTADVRGSALLVTLMDGTADVRFRDNRVLAWWSTGIHVLSQGTASATARINNNFVDNTNGALAGAMGIVAAGCRLGFNISGNTVRHTNGAAISTDMSPGCVNTVQGTIDGNFIGVSGDTNSGTGTGVAIAAGGRAGTTTVKISNNVLRQINGSANGAITVVAGDNVLYGGSGTLNATISGNNIQETGSTVNSAQHGILVTHGTTSSGANDSHQGCYDIVSNTISNLNTASGAAAQNRLRVNQRFGTTSRFPGYTGGQFSTTDLATYLLSRNTASNATNANTSTGGFLNTVPAGSACPQPTM